MSFTVLLGLILCNAIWATNPSMGKIVMQEFAPLHVSWLRYGLSLLSAYLLLILLRMVKPNEVSSTNEILKKRNFFWVAVIACTTFFWSPYAQYIGLSLSTSTANAIIVAMEPLFAVFLAWIFLKEKLNHFQVLAVGIALVGFMLLSSLKPFALQDSLTQFNTGNIFLLLVMPAEAMYTIASRKLMHDLSPLSIFCSALSLGFFLFTSMLLLRGYGLPNPFDISSKSLLALIWMGPIGTTLTYAYWTLALKEAPVAAVALTLFVQPILGAIAGTIFMGETLDFWQKLGGALILVALLIQTKLSIKESHD